MPDAVPEQPSDAQRRQRALANWENEGGAGPNGPLEAVHLLAGQGPLPNMGAAEMMALHVRMVALENLVVALLATASPQQRQIAREMAAYISPRLGATPHPLTTLAAAHMDDLVERAVRFDTTGTSGNIS
ncbi:MAG: hypothetical protein ABIQ66_11040 [Novosphingobium sp.]